MEHLSTVTKWNAFRVWRQFFNWRLRTSSSPSPMATMQKPTIKKALPKTLTWPQVERILGCCKRPLQKTLINLILDTGLRASEIAGITLQDLEEDRVRVTGKTGTRFVPISPAVREMVRQQLPFRDRRYLYNTMRKPIRRAGVTSGGLHLLRHTFALHWVMGGGDVFSLQRIMGHTDITTTRIYVEMAMSDVLQQHGQYSPALRLPAEPPSNEAAALRAV